MPQYLAIDDLLSKYTKVFKVLVGLPPLRGHKHQIVLKEGSPPISERPYRYPFYQKIEIEKVVHELLEFDSIKVSQTPFSSPVLLVRKVDGSWQM